jgi:DNA-binding transcriptional LysR family regulator
MPAASNGNSTSRFRPWTRRSICLPCDWAFWTAYPAGSSHRPSLRPRRERIGGSNWFSAASARIDLALSLVERGGDRFAERPIVTEGYALAIPAGHPLADRQEITAEELANDVMIVRRNCEALSDISRHFTERGVRPHFALRSTNDERVMQMVAATLGVTVMPESYRYMDVLRPRLSGFALQRTIGWAAVPDSEHLLTAPIPFMKAVTDALRNP